jgi:hypothetical protein
VFKKSKRPSIASIQKPMSRSISTRKKCAVKSEADTPLIAAALVDAGFENKRIDG